MTKKKDVYFEAVGKRKSAVARVRIFEKPPEGQKKGTFTINDQELAKHFPLAELRKIIKDPFVKTETNKNFYSSIKVNGGGIKAQAEATRLGISRALLKFNENFRQILKESGFLTRDSRIKERKKFGLKKARKAPQWSKR
ncbi:30S ribosomal protein S9 [Patescibacteria group bacterium]